MSFNKVIIYGHKLHTHTSSYVHYGFYKAFKELNYNTLWVDDNDDISNINFDNSLFLTEGQVDNNIPLNKSSKYILHNCFKEKYNDLNYIKIQFVYNEMGFEMAPVGEYENFIKNNPILKINNYTYWGNNTLYQPWATDLVPREIDLNDAHNELNNKECIWIGTYGGGDTEFQNQKQLDPFFNECKKNRIKVKIIDPWAAPVSPEKNRELVKNAFMAPAIQGAWQVNHGYGPPCRLLKNISYGHIGITNSNFTNSLFDNKLVYDNDSSNLFYKVMEKKNNSKIINDTQLLMDEVKENHTFINRINQILKLI